MNKLLNIALSSAFVLTSSYAHEHSKHWGYEGDVAPSHWSSLNEKFSLCSNGKMQSPINIVPTLDKDLKPLELNYTTSSSTVINNGHTVQVNIKSGSTLTTNNTTYELKQFHFHTPSENNINGNSYPLEAHFVHASKDGKLAVVAVMFKEGEENKVLNKIWSKFPLTLNKKTNFTLTSNDINNLMPKNKDYYKFEGSLTTPPCTQGVSWNVYKNTVTISKEQVSKFFKVFNHTNNRPIQNTNNRNITK